MIFRTDIHRWSHDYAETLEQDYKCYTDKKNFFKNFCNQIELQRFKDYLKQIMIYEVDKMRRLSQYSLTDKINNRFVQYVETDETFDSIEIIGITKKLIFMNSEFKLEIKFQRFEFKVILTKYFAGLIWIKNEI
jgi:hypothetical protein